VRGVRDRQVRRIQRAERVQASADVAGCLLAAAARSGDDDEDRRDEDACPHGQEGTVA
jgi:hypothetical protein